MDRRPNQSLGLVPLANAQRVSHAHELGADDGLGGCESKWRKGDTMRLQNCRFKIGERGEADVEISSNNEKFLQFVGYSPTDRRFRWDAIPHGNLRVL